ncbi:MAG TPA: cytochrome c [Bacteroidia bacterium]|nr:cytochrome c [Bacteroidia bacterium]HRH07023.1 cytochrome c [Bacteroidia bacterium]
MNLLTIHKVSVILFLLIYLIKTILLVANQTENLEKFKKLTKVLEMIVSASFLITGIWMLVEIGSIKPFQIIKICLVLASIPVAVIAYKKSNKVLAIVSLLMIIMSYGLAEMSRKQRAVGSNDMGLHSSDTLMVGQTVYTNYCVKCHGQDGNKGFMGALDLTLSSLDEAGVADLVANGKGNMTAFKDQLTAEQIHAVAVYVKTMKH